MDKYGNDFYDMYISQLEHITKSSERLLRTIQSLKDKKVIENTYPFDAELVGRVLNSEEANNYRSECSLQDADLKLIRVLLDINQNKTNYIKCKYNEEIEKCLKSDYVGNLIKKKLHIMTEKSIGEIETADLESIVNSIYDPFIINIYISYLFILDSKNTRAFVKEMLGPSYIAKKLLELNKPKRKKVDEKYLIEIGRRLSRYDERYYKSYIKMVEKLDSDDINIFESRLLDLADNDFKNNAKKKLIRIK